jgi:hypothetical protein
MRKWIRAGRLVKENPNVVGKTDEMSNSSYNPAEVAHY